MSLEAPVLEACDEERASLVPGHNAPQRPLSNHADRRVMHLCKGYSHLPVHGQQCGLPGFDPSIHSGTALCL